MRTSVIFAVVLVLLVGPSPPAAAATPTAATMTPTAGARINDDQPAITAVFDQDVSVVGLGGVTITTPAGEYRPDDVAAVLGADQRTITVSYGATPMEAATYTVTIPAGSVSNDDGETNAPVFWHFTVDLTVPAAETLLPAASTTVTDDQPSLSAEFSEAVGAADLTGVDVTSATGESDPATVTPTLENRTLSIGYDGTLADDTYTVTIPPGAVTDGAGNGNALVEWSFTVVRPSTATSTIDAAPAELTADGSSTATVTVQLKDDTGGDVPVSGGTVALQASTGTLGDVTDDGDGSYRATLTAPTDTGTATITGTLDGAALDDDATVTFVAGDGDATTSLLTADPAVIPADGETTSTVTLRVRDPHDNDVGSGGATVVLSTTAGTLGDVADLGDGTYRATLTAPTVAGGTTLTATLDGTAVTDEATVAFTTPPEQDDPGDDDEDGGSTGGSGGSSGSGASSSSRSSGGSGGSDSGTGGGPAGDQSADAGVGSGAPTGEDVGPPTGDEARRAVAPGPSPSHPVRARLAVPGGVALLRFDGLTGAGELLIRDVTDTVHIEGIVTVAAFDLQLDGATFAGAEVCLPFDRDAAAAVGALPRELRLYHLPDAGPLADITSDGKRQRDVVCGWTEGFSTFVLGVPAVTRLSGSDRVGTAAAVAAARFEPGVPVAFVAGAGALADALTGGPAAARMGGPLLLTDAATLSEAARDELSRLRPGRIVLLGGPGAVGRDVEDQLIELTEGRVSRWWGRDRLATAAVISRHAFPAGADTVFVVGASNFADAVAGGAVAAATGHPVLLAERHALPEAMAFELRRLSPRRIVVLGGTAAVSDAVLAELGGLAAVVERVAGADRYATAAAVGALRTGAEHVPVFLASGVQHADAIAAVPAAALTGSVLLLVRPDGVPDVTARELRRRRPSRIVVVGGTGVVSAAVEEAAHALT